LGKATRAALLVAPLVLQPSIVAAQGSDPPPGDGPQNLAQLDLEDLLRVKVDTVYAASKFVQEVAQAPASVSIITAEEIRDHDYRTLADILGHVRGFYVSYDRNYRYVGLRGFSRPGDYNSRILLLLNGHRLNDPIYDEALLGTESPIDVSLLDRVEVIRGPSSSLYGTSAFFAVVNLVTRSGRALSGVELEGQGGSQAFRNGRATTGGRTANGLEGLVSFSAFETRGNSRLYFPEFNEPPLSNGIVRNADGDRSTNLFASAAAHGFQLQMAYGSRTKKIPTASFGTSFDDPRSETTDARGLVDVQFTRAIHPRLTLQARASYDQYDYDGSYAYDEGIFLDGAHAAWATTEVALVRRFDRHNLTGGIEYRRNFRENQWSADWNGVVLDDRRQSSTAAAFVEDEFRINRHLLINGGVRWDRYFNSFGSTVNPRVGIIVFPSEGTALKVLYGRAFRAPNPFELYYEQGPRSMELGPERIVTNEVVWEQRVGRRLQLTASVFHNRVTDLITQRGGSLESVDGLYYANYGGLAATGMEWEAQLALPGRIRTRFAHAFQSATDDLLGGSAYNSPGQLSTIVVDLPIARSGLHASFNATYIGDRQTVRGIPVPAAFVSNLTLSRALPRSGLRLSLSLHNLFDAAYADPGAEEHRQLVIPQDGRTLNLRATWRF
jgi:iron complex outermembrane receptor protein